MDKWTDVVRSVTQKKHSVWEELQRDGEEGQAGWCVSWGITYILCIRSPQAVYITTIRKTNTGIYTLYSLYAKLKVLT